MAGIKIIPEATKPFVPKSKEMSKTVPRFKAPGGKPPLPLQKSYNRQGSK